MSILTCDCVGEMSRGSWAQDEEDHQFEMLCPAAKISTNILLQNAIHPCKAWLLPPPPYKSISIMLGFFI